MKQFFNDAIKESVIRLRYFRNKKRFLSEWIKYLCSDAAVFAGLYAGLSRIKNKESKTPEKTLKEWYDRTRFKWCNEEITKICEKTLKPAIESADDRECKKWAVLLLKAAQEADIYTDENKDLILDDNNALAYFEWNGKEIYSGDTVRIMNPAWYQKGRIIEQGYCTLLESGDE